MTGIILRKYQVDAIGRMRNGCILNGNVGSGKSRTALGYYYIKQGGKINSENYVKMVNPQDLYIITTAAKRDTKEWDDEMGPFRMSTDPSKNSYSNKVVVDSWNNISKYTQIKNAFFIFDEQRVGGHGKWTKSFLKIAENNNWILLSATPGDTWSDYLSIFIANGFFKNKTQFNREHVIFSPWVNYPKISRYINEGPLIKMRKTILINMEDNRTTEQHHIWLNVKYDELKYKMVEENRWNPYNNLPIQNASELCFVFRRISNEHPDRCLMVKSILAQHPKAIIFYSFNYERDILKKLFEDENYPYTEWTGHKHEKILSEKDGYDKWVYLVEYAAGAEGWNCITTDTIIFFSPNYSYKNTVQASGRIDRINTPYKDLFYYHLKTNSSIDKRIISALRRKKNFNTADFASKYLPKKEKQNNDIV